MPARARHLVFVPPLLLAAAQALAQAPSGTQAAVTGTDPPALRDWPQAPSNGTQTSFRIRRDAADGTVVGMSLQQSRFPSFLLQLELVPPGHGPAIESDKQHSPSAPVVEQNLRTVHKLSLRYRF